MGTWLDFDNRNTPGALSSQYSVHGGGGISAALLQRRDPYADLVKTLAPEVRDYLARKRNDEIANQLMEQLQVPQEQRFNGGAEGLHAYQMYQQEMNKRQDRQYQLESDGMTAYQREQTRLREMDIQRKERKAQGKVLARGRLNDKNEFDNQYPEAATGDIAKVLTPDGKIQTVPYSEPETSNPALDSFQQAQRPGDKMPMPSGERIATKEQYDALPSGAIFIDPDGKKRRKP